MVKTTIQINVETLEKLKKIKITPRESYDAIINRLLKEANYFFGEDVNHNVDYGNNTSVIGYYTNDHLPNHKFKTSGMLKDNKNVPNPYRGLIDHSSVGYKAGSFKHNFENNKLVGPVIAVDRDNYYDIKYLSKNECSKCKNKVEWVEDKFQCQHCKENYDFYNSQIGWIKQMQKVK